ncbi:hypothetical protein UCDDS831_g07195 [Diplodia seriata]|uniref:Uncharacterized protein n=1 Tax=Diplodia seriata TaxID=420778 RepID=A0A0G2DZD1_9PEZI|nr:hypothetical protein UCDDS831_g07195 [Diplodia seriata]
MFQQLLLLLPAVVLLVYRARDLGRIHCLVLATLFLLPSLMLMCLNLLGSGILDSTTCPSTAMCGVQAFHVTIQAPAYERAHELLEEAMDMVAEVAHCDFTDIGFTDIDFADIEDTDAEDTDAEDTDDEDTDDEDTDDEDTDDEDTDDEDTDIEEILSEADKFTTHMVDVMRMKQAKLGKPEAEKTGRFAKEVEDLASTIMDKIEAALMKDY